MWKQEQYFDKYMMGTEKGYCLRNVRKGFDLPAKFASALDDLKNNIAKGTLHDISTLPSNVSVPVYLDTASKYDHIIVSDKGKFYEDGKRVYNTKNFKFYGWGELLNDYRIVEWIPEKTNVELAVEVIQGLWGNGKDRIKRLAAAGYDFYEVQKIVNEMLNHRKSDEQIAMEVIAGKWGNGQDRKNRLQAEGYNYENIQKIVNELMK